MQCARCSRWLSAGLLLLPLAAGALDFSDLTSAYAEDFAGETGVPTTPELDTLGFGNVVVAGSGNAPPPAPVMNGQVDYAVTSSGSTGTEIASASLLSGVEWTRDVGIRSDWVGFSSSIVGSGHHVVGVSVLLGEDIGDPDLAALALVQRRIDGPETFFLNVSVFDLEAGATLPGNAFVTLGSGEAMALAAGDPFTLDLRLNRADGTLEATFEIGGTGVAPAPVPLPIDNRDVLATQAIAQAVNASPLAVSYGGDDPLSVTLTGLEIGTLLRPTLDLSDLELAYRESFKGETGGATTPEVDVAAWGAVDLFGFGNAVSNLPELNESVEISLASVDGPGGAEQSGTFVETPLGADVDVAVRATFEGLARSPLDPAVDLIGPVVFFDAESDIDTPDFTLTATIDRFEVSPFPTFHRLAIQRFDLATGDVLTLASADLSVDQGLAIEAGDPFEVVLRFERPRRARAALVIAGETLLVGPVAVPGPDLPIAGMGADARVLNAIEGGSTGEDDGLSLSIQELEIHRAPSAPRARAR